MALQKIKTGAQLEQRVLVHLHIGHGLADHANFLQDMQPNPPTRLKYSEG